jgi:hypothetical protein
MNPTWPTPFQTGSGPKFGACFCFAKSSAKWFCEIVDDPWWFLDEFCWVLISFLLFFEGFQDFVGFLGAAGRPVAVVPLAFFLVSLGGPVLPCFLLWARVSLGLGPCSPSVPCPGTSWHRAPRVSLGLGLRVPWPGAVLSLPRCEDNYITDVHMCICMRRQSWPKPKLVGFQADFLIHFCLSSDSLHAERQRHSHIISS